MLHVRSVAPATRARRLRDHLSRLSHACRLAWSASPASVTGALAAAILQGLAPVGIAWSTKALVDATAEGSDVLAVNALAGLLLFTAVAAGATIGGQYVLSELRRRVEVATQLQLFAAVNRLPGLSHFERPAYRNTLEMAEQAGQLAPGQVVRSTLGLLEGFVTVGAFALSLLLVDPLLVVALASTTIVSLLVEVRLGRDRAEMLLDVTPARRRAMAYQMLQTDAQAAQEIRLHGSGDFLLGEMRRHLTSAAQQESAQDKRELRMGALSSGVSLVAIGAGLAVVVARAVSGSLDPGQVVIALVALTASQAALASMVRDLADIDHALLLLQHFRAVVAESGSAVGNGREVERLSQEVRFTDVWFRYAEDQEWVLQGVDLVVPAGSTVALVGVNGAGKSSVVKLLCGLYRPERGTVTWDGQSVQDLSAESLRSRISVVFQDYMAYDLSAAANIGIGDLRQLHDRERIEAAARDVDVHEAVDRLPLGYDTLLSRIFAPDEDAPTAERSTSTLSGGQWQRVAVARALLRADADLLVMDEPSSGLDAEAEHHLHQRLRDHRTGRASLIITHRLSAVRQADQIVVLEGGRTTERGTHDELLTADGLYAALFRRQAAGYQSEPV